MTFLKSILTLFWIKKIIKADLHIHTCCSDGKFSVSEVIDFAYNNNIQVLSITDHDCIYDVELAIKKCNQVGIKLIRGIEFSTDFDGHEIHILGYGINYNNQELNSTLHNQAQRRIFRLNKIIDNLNSLGFKLDYSEFTDTFSESKAFGRMHIAEILKKKKYVKSIREAFNKLIGDNCIADVKKENYSTYEIVKLIRKLKGISVVAHPEKNSVKEKLNDLLKLGINGIEVIHPSHTIKEVKSLSDYAEKNGLIKTGGSDFHGIINSEIKNIGKFFINLDSDFLLQYCIN